LNFPSGIATNITAKWYRKTKAVKVEKPVALTKVGQIKLTTNNRSYVLVG
jgi:hypothetical protein